MLAIAVPEFGGTEVVELRDVPIPHPGPGQVRVRVHASTVAKIDISTRNGAISQAGLLGPHQDIGLGWDVAGIVDAIGGGVGRFAAGDEVIGLRDLLFAFPGAHAEYVILHQSTLARAPRGTTHVQAATIPLAGLTADRALALTGLAPGWRRPGGVRPAVPRTEPHRSIGVRCRRVRRRACP